MQQKNNAIAEAVAETFVGLRVPERRNGIDVRDSPLHLLI
jgi:hypothetical protein